MTMEMKQQNTTLWEKRYERSRNMLRAMIEQGVPKVMVQNEARLLLTAYYGGPWKLIWALIKHQLVKAWYHHAGRHSERIRVKVFRRIPDPVLEVAERVAEEDEEIERMVKSL